MSTSSAAARPDSDGGSDPPDRSGRPGRSDGPNRPDPPDRPVRSNHPFAAEFAVVVAALVVVFLWRELVRTVLQPTVGLPDAGGLLASGLVYGALFVGGLALFAAGYARHRGIRTGLTLPARRDLWFVAAAAAVPAILTGLTKVVGVLTGVPYNALTMASVGADASLAPLLAVTAVGVLVGVPTLVLVCQVLVQGSFGRVVDDDAAVVLTTLVTGFVLLDGTGGLGTVPDRGKLVGAVAFALLFGVAAFADDRTDDPRLRALAYAPLVLLAGLAVLEGIAGIGTVAAGVFVLAQVATLGVAAVAYDRTGSLVAPALAYASLFVADQLVVVLFEAGMQSW